MHAPCWPTRSDVGELPSRPVETPERTDHFMLELTGTDLLLDNEVTQCYPFSSTTTSISTLNDLYCPIRSPAVHVKSPARVEPPANTHCASNVATRSTHQTVPFFLRVTRGI